jgi:hypothetical protein
MTNTAALLDPRSVIHHVPVYKIKASHDLIVDYIAHCFTLWQPAAAEVQPPPAAAAAAADIAAMLAELEDVDVGTKDGVIREVVAMELKNHLKDAVTVMHPLDRKQRLDYDVSAYWRTKSAVYPHLAHVARSLLSVQATSAASERLFSSAGLISSKLRSSLSPDTLEACATIRDAVSRGVDVIAAVAQLRERVTKERREARAAKRQKGADGAAVAPPEEEKEEDEILDLADEDDIVVGEALEALGEVEEGVVAFGE